MKNKHFFKAAAAGLAAAAMSVCFSASAANPSFVTKDNYLSVNTKAYTIKATYPEMRNKVINGYFSKDINALIARFKKMESVPQRPNEMMLTYNAYEAGKVASVVVADYIYTGGAHGMTEMTTYNYSLSTNRRLNESDIFKGDWKTKLSKLVEPLANKEVKDRHGNRNLGKDEITWIKDGVKPVKENYTAYYFRGSYIIVIFSQYQIAPYADGIFEIAVPLKDIKSNLTPAFIKLAGVK